MDATFNGVWRAVQPVMPQWLPMGGAPIATLHCSDRVAVLDLDAAARAEKCGG